MTKVSTKPPSGTRDFLPQDVLRRRYLTGVIEEVYARYGFVPLETPAYENLTTLLGKYGEEGDQLIFRLLHRREALARALSQKEVAEADLADLGLRYDLTVPLARVVAEHSGLPRFFKRYQIQPVWRADRPGRGRYREFYQCDVDVIGTESPIAEAEVMNAVVQVLRRLGFADFTLRVNDRRLLRGLVLASGVAPELEALALVAIDKLDRVGRDGVREALRERGVSESGADRLVDLLLDETQTQVSGDRDLQRLEAMRETFPSNEDIQSGALALAKLFDLLRATPAGEHARFHPELARGLSYYTGPIFEITVPDLAGSLGGGGRYDGLIGAFANRPIPAVGFSLGLERLLLVMEERGMYPDLRSGPDVLLCWWGVSPEDALRAAEALRSQGVRVETYPEPAKLGKQLQYADAGGHRTVAILASAEQSAGALTLKNLASGEQTTAPLQHAARTILGWREGAPS